jgi:hypothetical protein
LPVSKVLRSVRGGDADAHGVIVPVARVKPDPTPVRTARRRMQRLVRACIPRVSNAIAATRVTLAMTATRLSATTIAKRELSKLDRSAKLRDASVATVGVGVRGVRVTLAHRTAALLMMDQVLDPDHPRLRLVRPARTEIVMRTIPRSL